LKTRTLDQLAQKLRQKHAELSSWPKTSVACKVLTADGRPDPALALRIATKGYEPKRFETRLRLGLPPICVTCGQRFKRVRHVPAWLDEAVANLQKLEAEANIPLEENRVYSRAGKRVLAARDLPAFESNSQSPLLSMYMCV
jgi:hypothetical protein